ncbi:Membrane-anchored ubiquitin-fold protein 3 [Hibiscus syriacus]|uniref:Membrane-anchored ubiquitin-fold protein n=1 Tax=Hibiscus syriacus TaxID=106335 RepID=A0A6A3A940_HIBSY|nr:membrane-anchored ubiquitin-fold protein 3-like [Hibiscus syriacus]KAE8699489.1 Membrane-anchored ubiquitin-fold protein 3 [Hibiscus syriacus]
MTFHFNLQARKRRAKPSTVAQDDRLIELRFRLCDGKDIARGNYKPSMTVSTLKEKIVAEWPQGNTVTPPSINDLKLIHGGKILRNNKTLACCTNTVGDFPEDVITMHVLVQPAKSKRKTANNKEELQKLNPCGCIIL